MTTSDRFYEVLGLRPGASRQELKAAYRDLTKVWHPDRFTHDPRLQQKAEEKLKEINEAYEELTSGKRWRPRVTPAPRPSYTVARERSEQRNSHSPVTPTKSRSVVWPLAAVVVLGSLFAVTILFLHARANRQSDTLIERSAAQSDAPSRDDMRPTEPQSNRKSEPSVTSRQSIEQQPVATTTVTIDSTTGLLARDACPTKIKMTYPTGSEPHAYCNSHSAQSASNPHPQSRLKSLQRDTDSPADPPEKNPPEF